MLAARSDMADMTGRAALITGAAAGLGAASAIRLAELGADIVIVDLDGAGLDATAAEIRKLGREVLVLPLDLSDRANCRAAIDRSVAEFGRLDALCNVAGVMRPGPTAEMTDEAWDLTLAVNLSAPFLLTRAAIPHLLASPGGAVVNVTSCAAFQGQAYFAAYCATKAALTNMTKALAMEFMKQPLRINAVAPGGMMTALAGDMMKYLPADGTDWSLIERIGSPRGLCEISDVAECVAFLATDAARSYHGACINIDAGVTAD